MRVHLVEWATSMEPAMGRSQDFGKGCIEAATSAAGVAAAPAPVPPPTPGWTDHAACKAVGDFFKVLKQVKISPPSLPLHDQWHIPSAPPLPSPLPAATPK